MNWTGIWQSRTTVSQLYIFQEEDGAGDYQVIHVMEKNGETQAIRGSLYSLDEITVDYDVPEILHAAIVGDPYHGSLDLTSFPILDDRMTSWMPVIEVDADSPFSPCTALISCLEFSSFFCCHHSAFARISICPQRKTLGQKMNVLSKDEDRHE